jgi:hypothetical protein
VKNRFLKPLLFQMQLVPLHPGDGKSQSLLFRATRLARPAVSAALSLALGAASATYVASKAAAAGVFSGGGDAWGGDQFMSVSADSVAKLAEDLLAVHTPAKSNEWAMIIVGRSLQSSTFKPYLSCFISYYH